MTQMEPKTPGENNDQEQEVVEYNNQNEDNNNQNQESNTSENQIDESEKMFCSKGKHFKSRIPSLVNKRMINERSGQKDWNQTEAITLRVGKVSNMRPSTVSGKVRRSDRNKFAKSVIIEGNQCQEGRRHGFIGQITKTLSEHDVSQMLNLTTDDEDEAATSLIPLPHVSALLPKSNVKLRNKISKPRPISSYVIHPAVPSPSPSSLVLMSSSSDSGDKQSHPAIFSKIPKRIVGRVTRELTHSATSSPSSALNESPPHTTPSSAGSTRAMTCSVVNNKLHAPRKPSTTPTYNKENLSERIKSRQEASKREFVRPRLVTILRYGMRPRKAFRFLLNKKTARDFTQVLNEITLAIKPDWGAVRKVYTLDKREVLCLESFFDKDDVFLVCPNDKITSEDFELDSDECKSIQPFAKALLISSQIKKVRGSLTIDSVKSPIRRPKSSPNGPSLSASVDASFYSSHPKYLPLNHFPQKVLQKYFVGDVIGDGNFAVVRLITDRTIKKKFALKIIDKSKSTGRDAPPEHEVKILSSIAHPNIILIYEQYDFANELYVVMEYVPGGDLFDAISRVTKFSEEESTIMTRDVANALAYLHARKIVHRDIKPENLLVFDDGSFKRIKLGDFGLAEIVTKFMYTVCGTPTYVAPEILAETGYGLKVDVWALGVIIYVLLCGYPPFIGPTGAQEELFELILSGDYEFHSDHWDEISLDAKDLITRMMEPDVAIRLAANEVLEHPWLAENEADCKMKRDKFYQKDFECKVFEAMGLQLPGLGKNGHGLSQSDPRQENIQT